jgi:hypothetical protein
MSATAIPRLETRRAGLAAAAAQVLLGAMPVAASLLLLGFQIKLHGVATDFHFAYYPAALRLLHGGDPYALAAGQLARGRAFVYPALAAVLLAPFAAVGRAPGEVLFVLLCVSSAVGTLRALDVRDWRVYGITLLWSPIYSGWQTANLTLPLMLMVALVWRHRDRPAVAGLLAAAAISLKPFVWPLALWLLATRRFKASLWTVVWGIGLNLIAWGIVGFGRIGEYLHVSGQDTDALWRGGYSLLAAGHRLGLSRSAGEAALVVVAAALVLAVIRDGRRGHERQALALATATMLVASPLVWNHYFALLLVPLALARPRLSPIWALPLLMWACPPTTGAEDWQVAVAWVVFGACLGGILRTRSPRPAQTTSVTL